MQPHVDRAVSGVDLPSVHLTTSKMSVLAMSIPVVVGRQARRRNIRIRWGTVRQVIMHVMGDQFNQHLLSSYPYFYTPHNPCTDSCIFTDYLNPWRHQEFSSPIFNRMGMSYRRYLNGERIYGCSTCKTHLATIHSMISRVRKVSYQDIDVIDLYP